MWINRIGACWDAPIAPNYLILTITTLPTDIVTDLAEIARLAALREEENDHFRSFIERKPFRHTSIVVSVGTAAGV